MPTPVGIPVFCYVVVRAQYAASDQHGTFRAVSVSAALYRSAGLPLGSLDCSSLRKPRQRLQQIKRLDVGLFRQSVDAAWVTAH